MSDNLSPIKKLADGYGNNPYVRALLHLLPGWSSADVLIQQLFDEIRIKRLRTFFDELSNGEIELDENIIKNDDFLHCYFSTVKAAINTRRHEKIKLFAKLLKSSISDSIDSSTDEYEEMLEILDALSLREFSVLSELKRLETNIPKKDENELEISHITRYWESFRSIANTKFGIPPKTLESFMVKIERTGLYLRLTQRYYEDTGYLGRTTPLFSRLLDFLKNY